MESASIIVFDLDQTLAESKAPLDSEMASLLRELLLIKKIAIISGASFSQFQNQFLDHFDCSPELLQNLYLLPTNGAVFYQYKDGWQRVYSHELSEEEKREIFRAFEETFVETGFKKEKEIFGVLIEDRGTQITFSGLGSQAPLLLKGKWDPEHKKRDILTESLRAKIPNYSVRIGGTTSIDVTGRGIDKAYGITELMRRLGYAKDEVFYVGDALFPGGNDSSVIPLGIGYEWVRGGVEDAKKLIKGLLFGRDFKYNKSV